MHIVVVCGTNREGVLSRLLAQEAAACYEAPTTVDLLDMNELPAEVLLPSAYKEQPEAVAALVQRFLKADGVVFVIPEYNGSYPGIVKLFVDMLPYPEGFDSRPCAFIGLAAGQFKKSALRRTLSASSRLPQCTHLPTTIIHRRQLQAIRRRQTRR